MASDITNNLSTRKEFIKGHKTLELAIVLELGSKSLRLLVGPKMTSIALAGWNPFTWFHAEAYPIDLRLNELTNEIDLENPAFQKIVLLINSTKSSFPTVAIDNYTLIGTEIYRAANNQNKIIEHILQNTGLTLTILSYSQEALCSMLALIHTCQRPSIKIRQRPIASETSLLLIDQGGGSTEIISYEFQSKTFSEPQSFSQLGTNILKDGFLNNLENSTVGNHMIETNFLEMDKRIKQYIESICPKVLKSRLSKDMRVFAMGSTILKAMGQLKEAKFSGKYLHCENIGAKELGRVQDQSRYSIIKNYDGLNPSALREAIKEENSNERLMLALGIYPYRSLMKFLNVQEIQYSYFNLKHGIFLAKYHHSFKDFSVSELKNTMLNLR